jgi:hypothetical protein
MCKNETARLVVAAACAANDYLIHSTQSHFAVRRHPQASTGFAHVEMSGSDEAVQRRLMLCRNRMATQNEGPVPDLVNQPSTNHLQAMPIVHCHHVDHEDHAHDICRDRIDLGSDDDQDHRHE